jgi:deferrochelatase/peroxidase EfeB
MSNQDTLAVVYLKQTGSALPAVPPGTSPGGYIGEGLFS